MADEPKSFKILDKPPVIHQTKGESAEHFVARAQFLEATIAALRNGKFVNLDGNGDGVLKTQEAINALIDPQVKAGLPEQGRNAMLRSVTQATKEKRSVLVDVDTLTKELQETQVIRANDGGKISLERGKIPEKYKGVVTDAQIESLDRNKDGKVSRGEFQFRMMENAQQLPPPPPKPRNRSA